MDNAVALAALGIAASTIGGFIWLAKFVARTLGNDLQEHTKAAIAQTASNVELQRSVEKLSRASDEQHTFMKRLNGKLSKAVIQTVNEQRVRHQTVEKQDETTE